MPSNTLTAAAEGLPDLTDVADDIAMASHFIEAATMACRSLGREQMDPMAAVLSAAADRLREAQSKLAAVKIGGDA